MEGITSSNDWMDLSNDEFQRIKRDLSAILEDFPVKTSPNEANTIGNLINPVMRVLGWPAPLAEEALGSKGREDIPDALFFLTDGARKKAEEEKKSSDRFKHGIAIVESKKWQLDLDRRPDKKSKRGAPSTQIINYLDRAKLYSERAVMWGILTNGREWRLYYQDAKSRSEEFLDIDLAGALQVTGVEQSLFVRGAIDSNHWLKIFILMFRRGAFEKRSDGQTFHQFALNEGHFWETRVRRNLSDVVFHDVYPTLVRAFWTADKEAPEPLTAEYLDELRDASLTFLYRLLFALYAEDRDLLPRHDPKYDDYGLSMRVREDIARRIDKKDVFSDKASQYFHHCEDLFRIIDQGDDTIGIPPYNGGLFHADRAPLLERTKLSDADFAPVFDKLSRRQEDGELKRINYRDLSVRELGSIYERLLEHVPVVDGSGIKIQPNLFARKGSGSYYTPDELVQLIIDRTVGPLVEERFEAFFEKANELASDKRAKTERLAILSRLDPAKAILNLKICDPAMGSGHFLVSLVDFLSDEVLRATEAASDHVSWGDYSSPLLQSIETIREQIKSQSETHKWHINEDQLNDKNLVRRMVLKRCVYGVDKNPTAVELAKVSLWLHSFTAGAPLSFLDHHLRCGDSLFGEWVRPFTDAVREKGAFFINPLISSAENTVEGMQRIEALSDADISEAKESASIFETIEESTADLKVFLDVFHASRWLGKEGTAAFQALMDGQFGEALDAMRAVAGSLEELSPKTKKVRDKFSKTLEKLNELIREERFLHWQIAFPGVWHNWLSAAPEGGFDAVIGNPPWDRMKMQEVEWFAARAPAIAKSQRAADRKKMIAALKKNKVPLYDDYVRARERAESATRVARKSGAFPVLSKGDINIYSLFVERAQTLIASQGVAGLLTPSGIASDKTASDFFKSISTSGRLVTLLDFENRRGERDGVKREPFFPDVDSRFKFCVLVASGHGRKSEVTECAFFLQDPPERGDDRMFEMAPEDFALVNPNTGTAPIFRTRRDAELTMDVYRRFPVLVDRSGAEPVYAWPVKYTTMFHMTNDSHLFWTRERLENEGAYPVEGNRWRKGEEEFVPLYEGKMVQAFDHRAADVVVNPENLNRPAQPQSIESDQKEIFTRYPDPQYRIGKQEIAGLVGLDFVIGFKDVTAATNIRTMISTLLPESGFGNTLPLLLPQGQDNIEFKNETVLAVACLNSLSYDYLCRQKVHGQHLNFFIVEQIPIVADYEQTFGAVSAEELIRQHVLRLSYTAFDMKPLAAHLGHTGDPFIWNDEERRHLRARLDALYFILYGITDPDDVRYILSTFPIVQRNDEKEFGFYLTCELILAYMRALQAGDTESVVSIEALAPKH